MNETKEELKLTEEIEENEVTEKIQQTLTRFIEKQIQLNDPPETKQAIQRLQDLGYSKEESFEFVARLVSEEVTTILSGENKFDMERYKKALNQLPKPYNHPLNM